MTETMEYWAAEELGESDLRNLHECEKKVTYQFRDLLVETLQTPAQRQELYNACNTLDQKLYAREPLQ